MHNTETRYIFYGRVSTKRQGDSGLGLDAQKDIAYHFYPTIEREFIEVKSGKKASDRPVLREAINFCKENKAILVVAKVDRLTRDTSDGLDILKEMNGQIRFCDLPGEPDKFMLTLFFAFAERERALISIRTKAALKAVKERGTKLGSASPSGNRTVWTKQANEESIKVRKQMSKNNKNNIRAFTFARALREHGHNYQVIAEKLNGSDFATPSGEGKWSKGSVYRLLGRAEDDLVKQE